MRILAFGNVIHVDIVINRILHFDVIACQKTALNYYNNYEQMMSSILEVFKSK